MTNLDQILADFGLSDTEIAVYRAVLEGGESTTGEIAENAGVTQSYVYSVAETLTDRNLVTIDDATSPTRIRARAPEEVTDVLSEQVTMLEQELQSLYSTPSWSPDGFSMLESRQTVIEYIEATIDAARKELLLVLPYHVVTDLESALESAGQRGVFTLLLLTETGGTTPAQTIDGPTMTRRWDASPPIYAIADGQSGVMGEPGSMSGRHGDEKTLAFANQTIADGFLGMALSNYWVMGEAVDAVPPRPLPAEYSCFRAGVFDAARRTGAGERLTGTVTVQNGDGERKTFEEAPILQVKQGLVEPTTNEFPNENSIVFDTDAGRVTVGCPGGIGSFYEDYAGFTVTLQSVSE